MLSEKDKALIIDALGENAVPFMADFGYATSVRLIASDLAAIINAARHQAQEEAKAVSVEGLDLDWLLERCRSWSADKDEDSVRALAWNVNGLIKEWIAAPQPPNQVEEASQGSGQRACGSRDDQAVGATAALAKAFPGVEGFGASYNRTDDAWHMYTMPNAVWFGSIQGYNKDRIDWIMGALRSALNPLPNQHTRDRIAELEEIFMTIRFRLEELKDRTGDETAKNYNAGVDGAYVVMARELAALNTKDKEGAET